MMSKKIRFRHASNPYLKRFELGLFFIYNTINMTIIERRSSLPPGTSLLGILCARTSLGTSRHALESISQRG